MSSIDALLKRAQKLTASQSTEKYEEEWEGLCAGAKERLMAELEQQIAAFPDEQPEREWTEEDQAIEDELTAWLEVKAEEARQSFIQLRKSGWKH